MTKIKTGGSNIYRDWDRTQFYVVNPILNGK